MAGETSESRNRFSGAKIAFAFGVILVGLSVPPQHWPVHGVLLAVLFIGQALAGIPLEYLVKRFAIFIPPLLLVSLSFPMSQGFALGWDVGAAILLRSCVAFSAGLWLIRVLTMEELIRTLQRYRVPTVLLTMLALAYRYVFVLWEELGRMQTARAARGFGRPRLWDRWRHSAQLVGMLLLRSLTRAERVHDAMRARGWDGNSPLVHSTSPTDRS